MSGQKRIIYVPVEVTFTDVKQAMEIARSIATGNVSCVSSSGWSHKRGMVKLRDVERAIIDPAATQPEAGK